jgi:hypothetical protein
MRYFRLEQDKRFTDIPYIMNGFNKIDGRKLRRGQSRSLPHRVLMELHPNLNTVFGDIILSPFPLLSEKAREAVNLYEQRLPYKRNRQTGSFQSRLKIALRSVTSTGKQ